jgi:hypothetical protein
MLWAWGWLGCVLQGGGDVCDALRGMDPGSSLGVTCWEMAPEFAAGFFCAAVDNAVSHFIQ